MVRAFPVFPSRMGQKRQNGQKAAGGFKPSPLRGRCRRSRRMRCSAPARLCRQMLHFASLTEILSLRYRLSVFLSRRKKNSEKERPLRGLRREVSPDLLRRTEMKSKSGAQCGSAPRDPPENGQAGRDKQQRCCAQRRKFPYSGQNLFAQRAARHDFDFAFPFEGCETAPPAGGDEV